MSQTLAISVIKKTGVEVFPSLVELNPVFKIYPRITPVPKPEVAPKTPIRNASTRKRVKISKFCAPIAFKVPISRVLSITEVYNVVIIPTAPTINDTIAILKRKELNPPVNSLIVSIESFYCSNAYVITIKFPYFSLNTIYIIRRESYYY